ncbi:MAG: hypothetical protein L3J34_11655 [Flavobacteriaceae bacterium]|nr:hypothetical protein [Flavobacteriaceae bacterium]
MENIFSLLQGDLKSEENLKKGYNEAKIVIYKNFIFEIIITKNFENKLNLHYNWKIGYLGKIILKNDYLTLINLVNKIKKTLKKEHFIVMDVVKI